MIRFELFFTAFIIIKLLSVLSIHVMTSFYYLRDDL